MPSLSVVSFSSAATSSTTAFCSSGISRSKTAAPAVAAAGCVRPSSTRALLRHSEQNAVGLPRLVPVFCRPVLASLVASFASVQASLALNYDDIVNNVKEASDAATTSAADATTSFFDLDGASSVVDFAAANPLAILAGFAAVSIPLIASRVIAKPQTSGSVSASDAFDKLSDKEENAQLLDIRTAEDIKAEGSPDLKSLRKRAVQVPYASEDEAFVDKVLAKYKDAETTTLYILDRFDGTASSVAKLLANSGFKGAYAIKGGAEGPNGWQKNELPWALPKKGFSLNIGNLKDIIGDGSGISTATSSLAGPAAAVAAAGVGLVFFSEAETALQLVGSAALVQLFVKKFLFAEDRKKTIADIKTFLDTKVAPKGLVDELKEIGTTLMPRDDEVNSAVANGSALLEEKLEVDSVTPEALVEKLEEKVGIEIPNVEEVESSVKEVAEAIAPPSVEAIDGPAAAEPETTSAVPEVSTDDSSSASVLAAFEGDEPSAFQEAGIGEDISAVKVEEMTPSVPASSSSSPSSSTALPKSPTPLSPYTRYPGLKPPSSPIPSRP